MNLHTSKFSQKVQWSVVLLPLHMYSIDVSLCVQVWMPIYWPSSQHSPGTLPSNTWCWGRTSTSRAGTEQAGNGPCRWCWGRWWMFFPPLSASSGCWMKFCRSWFIWCKRKTVWVELCNILSHTRMHAYTHTHKSTVAFCTDARLHMPHRFVVALGSRALSMHTRLPCKLWFSHSSVLKRILPPATQTRCKRAHGCVLFRLMEWVIWSQFICDAPWGALCCFTSPAWQVAYSIIYHCWWW